MAIIEPLRKDIDRPTEVKKHSAPVRLWHWLNLLIITGSLLSNLALHDMTAKGLYLIFYILLIITALTGLSMTFDQELGMSKVTSHSIKDFHGFCMYLILTFIVVHIVGVLLAERKESKGIVSDMINGGKT